jgi:hypothetical protein
MNKLINVANGGDERAASKAFPDGVMPPEGDRDYWRSLYVQERKCRQEWQQNALASAVVLDDARSAVLADLMRLASEAVDHTPDSFRKNVIALANRAHAISPKPRLR